MIKIRILDIKLLVKNEILYSFYVEEGAQNLTICGTGEMSDLYISNSGNGKIIRVRSGFTW